MSKAARSRMIIHARPASYLSISSLACELDVSETTVREMVEKGILPRPLKLSSGCVRFRWSDVEARLAGKVNIEEPVDEHMKGAINATAAR